MPGQVLTHGPRRHGVLGVYNSSGSLIDAHEWGRLVWKHRSYWAVNKGRLIYTAALLCKPQCLGEVWLCSRTSVGCSIIGCVITVARGGDDIHTLDSLLLSLYVVVPASVYGYVVHFVWSSLLDNWRHFWLMQQRLLNVVRACKWSPISSCTVVDTVDSDGTLIAF